MLITCPGSLPGERAERLRPLAIEEALTKIFWTTYHPTVAVLPHMQARKAGRIVHVGTAVRTGAEQSARGSRSEGLAQRMPAAIASSALAGFSASLRAELACDGVSITSIGSGARAGSQPVHAAAQLEGSRAARRILRAAALRKSAATLMPRMHGLFDLGALGLGRWSQLRAPRGSRDDSNVHPDDVRTGWQSQIASPTTLLRAASRGSRY
jgi:NAD(P)-dependent dehydrogenase (short-subunit alcohol dehydrogenase family)